MSGELVAEGMSSQGSLPSSDTEAGLVQLAMCCLTSLLGNVSIPDLLINIILFGERMEATHISDAH